MSTQYQGWSGIFDYTMVMKELTVQAFAGYAGTMTDSAVRIENDSHIPGELEARQKERQSRKENTVKDVVKHEKERLKKEQQQAVEQQVRAGLSIQKEASEEKKTDDEETEEEKKKKDSILGMFFSGLPKVFGISTRVDEFYQEIQAYGEHVSVETLDTKVLRRSYITLRAAAEAEGVDASFLSPLRTQILRREGMSGQELEQLYVYTAEATHTAVIHPILEPKITAFNEELIHKPLEQWTAQELENALVDWSAFVCTMKAENIGSPSQQMRYWHEAQKHSNELLHVLQKKTGEGFNTEAFIAEKKIALPAVAKEAESALALSQLDTSVQFIKQSLSTEPLSSWTEDDLLNVSGNITKLQEKIAKTGTPKQQEAALAQGKELLDALEHENKRRLEAKKETVVDLATQRAKQALEARYNRSVDKVKSATSLEDVKKHAELSDEDRLIKAEEVFRNHKPPLLQEGEHLSPEQQIAILAAHTVGAEQVGKNKYELAGVYNYTVGQLREKNIILQKGADWREKKQNENDAKEDSPQLFSKNQIRALMEEGIVGNGTADRPVTPEQARAEQRINPGEYRSEPIRNLLNQLQQVRNPDDRVYEHFIQRADSLRAKRGVDEAELNKLITSLYNAAITLRQGGVAGAPERREQEYAAEEGVAALPQDVIQDPILQAQARAMQEAAVAGGRKRRGKSAIPLEFGDAESEMETVYTRPPKGMPADLVEAVWQQFEKDHVDLGLGPLSDEQNEMRQRGEVLPILTRQEDAAFDKMLAILDESKTYDDLRKLLMRGGDEAKIGNFLRGRAFKQKKTIQVEGRINEFLNDDEGKFKKTDNFRKAKEYIRKMLVDSLREKNNRMATSIQDVAKAMAEKEPQKWGKGKSHAILNSDNSINEINFLKWLQEEMTDLDGLSPDDAVNFFSEVHVESGIYSSRLSFQEMYLRPGRYFYNEKTGERMNGLWDEAMHQVWLLGKSRNWNILHQRDMGNDEKLPGAMVAQSYDNAFTKDTSGMNTLHRILSMAQSSFAVEEDPNSDREGERKEQHLGQAVRRAILTYYHISDFQRLQEIHGKDSYFFAEDYTQAAITRLEADIKKLEADFEKAEHRTSVVLDEGKVTKEQIEEDIRVKEDQIRDLHEKKRRKGKGAYHQYKFVLSDDMFRDGKFIDTQENREKFTSKFNIFQNANPQYDNKTELRDRIKASLIEHYGLSQEEADYAELWAYSMTFWSGIAARNDITGTGYDAWGKLQNLREYRWRQSQPGRGAPYGNPYNWSAIKRLDTTFFEAMRTIDGKSLLEVIEGRSEENGWKMDLGDTIRHMHFGENKSKKWGEDHIHYIFDAYRKIIRHEDMNFDTFTIWDPFRGVIVDYKKAEEIMGGIIKDLRYAFSTWDGVDFSKKTRVSERIGTTKDNKPIIVHKDMYLAEAFFGPEILSDYYEKDEKGRFIKDEQTGQYIINIDRLQKDAQDRVLWKKLFRYQIAAELRSRRDWNSPYKRYSFAEVERIMLWLERMPGQIGGSDEDLADTHFVSRFFSKEDIEWIRKHAHAERMHMFLNESAFEGGMALMKGIFGETDKLTKYMFS